MSWKDEYIKTCWELWDNGSKTADEMFNGIGRYIENLLDKVRKETEQRVAKEIFGAKDKAKNISEWIAIMDKLREKYKGVE